MAEHILRIPRSDSEGDYVVLNVTSNGPSPLDLKLVATEGDAPYITTIKQSRISKLRAKKADLEDSAWATVLTATLLQQRVTGKNLEAVKDLEIVSSITDQQLNVTFRKNISGIIHRLGTLNLDQDESQEISLFGWVGTALEKCTTLEKEAEDLTDKYNEQGNILKRLNAQLEDLIKAKEEHENNLLEKFRELLNAKKLKIRDQQRLLAGAKVDPNKAAQVHASRSSDALRTPTTSRSSKRKAATTTSVSSDAEESGFEAMAVVGKDQDQDTAAEDQPGTPEKSDLDATEDEDEDEDLDAASVAQRVRSGPAAKGKVIEGGADAATEVSKPALPPPRRELPFKQQKLPQPMRRAETPGEAAQNDADDGGDTTSDDEL